MMNWLDDYIFDNETGYYLNYDGGLWVNSTEKDYVRHAAHGQDFLDVDSLIEISKDEFISRLIK